MDCLYHIDRFPSTSTPDTLVIITHHHQDHIQGKKKSFLGKIITSPMTDKLLQLPNTIPLPYFQTYETPDLTIQLIPNHHCAGSVGVIIHDKHSQQTIGYTGDFRIWDTTPEAIQRYAQHFNQCNTIYYDDSFRDNRVYSSIPTLYDTQKQLREFIQKSDKPIYIHINRTGIELLLKPWMNELSVSFHRSLSPAMKQILPILFPPNTCQGPHQIVFCNDKNLATIVPECTACYLKQCGNFPICFHNTPQELDTFLNTFPKSIQLRPCGYHIPLTRPS
jgi:hypothetical protein